MIICDLDVLEVVAEEASITGGISISDANAQAQASGPQLSTTQTQSFTLAQVTPEFSPLFGALLFNVSESNSLSSSSAA